MVKTLVIYDISDDKCRNQVIDKCKDYGLRRIQYSCFLGELNQNRRQELALLLTGILGNYGGDIQIIPLCDKDLRAREIINFPVKDGEQGNGDES